jgi:hypothetical protein
LASVLTNLVESQRMMSLNRHDDMERNLPTFSGDDVTEYSHFKKVVKMSLRQSNKGHRDKFYTLRGQLTGDAKGLIKYLQPTETAYTEAWRLLDAMYDNPRLVTTENIKLLESSKFRITERTYEQLKNFRSKFNGIYASIVKGMQVR